MTQAGLIELHLSPVLASAPPLAGRAASAPGASTQTPGVSVESTPIPGGQPPASPLGNMNMFIVMGAVMVLLLGMSAFTGNKEKKKRAALLASIGRNDRVQTIGGVIGTVVEMRDDEIVLRVDDNNNTRLTFTRSAVQGILKKRSDAPSDAEAVAAR